MPYQKIGTPVFWIDTLQYLESMGIGGPLTPLHDVYGLNPISDSAYYNPIKDGTYAYKWFHWGLEAPIPGVSNHTKYDNLDIDHMNIGNIDYMACLNHNLASTVYKEIRLDVHKWGAGGIGNRQSTSYLSEFDSYVNIDPGNKAYADGYSMSTIDLIDVQIFALTTRIRSDYAVASGSVSEVQKFGYPQIGCISIGKRYQMPHSPDLNLTQTYDYGSKEIEAKQGASLSNNMWQNPKWGNLGAWELATVSETEPFEVDQNAVNLASLARSGKKVYDLSFSYLDDGDVFGANQTLSRDDDAWQGIVTEDDYPDIDDNNVQDVDPDSDKFNKNILNDQSFYTSVIHKTNGGALPFIFQPNSEDKTNMIIAKLDMKAFSFKQVANGVYNVRLKIREV